MRPTFLTASILGCAAAGSACGAGEPGTASATAPRPQWPQEEIVWSDCDIRIDFGSFARGPDAAAMAAVDRILASDPAVVRVSRSRFGMEGEHSLCVRTAGEEAATRLAKRLVAAVPVPTSAPVTIASPAGRQHLPAH